MLGENYVGILKGNIAFPMNNIIITIRIIIIRTIQYNKNNTLNKNIVQALVLSKLYYNDVIYHSLPEYLQKRLQRVQKAAASFVLGKFARSADVLSLNWLPIKEQREWNVLKLSYKELYDENWPDYQKLQLVQHSRVLRSSKGSQLQVPLIKNTSQDQSAHGICIVRVFYNETKNFLVLKAWSRLG
jgi:hypothetical protein